MLREILNSAHIHLIMIQVVHVFVFFLLMVFTLKQSINIFEEPFFLGWVIITPPSDLKHTHVRVIFTLLDLVQSFLFIVEQVDTLRRQWLRQQSWWDQSRPMNSLLIKWQISDRAIMNNLWGIGVKCSQFPELGLVVLEARECRNWLLTSATARKSCFSESTRLIGLRNGIRCKNVL